MARMELTLLVVSLLTFAGWHMVEGGATLELRMNVYDNSEAKDMSGGSCDPFWGACDHYFTFSIDAPDGKQAKTDDAKTGSFYTYTTGYIQDKNVDAFGLDIVGMKNPIVQYFYSWPGAVLYKVFIKDDDSIGSDDDIDAIIYRLTATPEGTAGTAPWHNLVVRGMRKYSPTSMSFDYRLYCEVNYFGPSCTKHCVAKDFDSEGHFTCDPRTGDIVCLSGWENTATKCLTRVNQCLLANQCKNGATCVGSGTTYTCTCAAGFAGNVCEARVTGPCPAGYVGQSCDVKLCDYISCQNGGTCVDGVCKCPDGYSGSKCESANVCSTRPCKNDGTCYSAQYRCDCLPGFEGETCSITSLNITAGGLKADSKDEVSLVNAFNASQPRALLIALIVIASVFLILLIILLIFFVRFRRRALKAEKECVMLSHGASSSITEKSTKNNNNTYNSTRFNTLCSSSSSCDTDATSCRSPTSSLSAEPEYADLNDNQLARAEYAYANHAVVVKPDAPPKRSFKADDHKGDYLP